MAQSDPAAPQISEGVEAGGFRGWLASHAVGLAAVAGFLFVGAYAAWQARFSYDEVRMVALQPTTIEVNGSDEPRRVFDPSIKPVPPSIPLLPNPPELEAVPPGGGSLPGPIAQVMTAPLTAPTASPRTSYFAAANAGVRYQIMRKLGGGGFQGVSAAEFDVGDVTRLRLEANRSGYVSAGESHADGSFTILMAPRRMEPGGAIMTPEIELPEPGRREILVLFTSTQPEAPGFDAFRAALTQTAAVIRLETADGFVYVVNDAASQDAVIPFAAAVTIR